MTDTNRILISSDGHITPEPHLEYAHDERTGRTVLASEEHYAPVALIMAWDPTTGIVYAGASEEDALYGPSSDADDTTEAAPAPSPTETATTDTATDTAPTLTWQEQAEAAGWVNGSASGATIPAPAPSATPIADSIPTTTE